MSRREHFFKEKKVKTTDQYPLIWCHYQSNTSSETLIYNNIYREISHVEIFTGNAVYSVTKPPCQKPTPSWKIYHKYSVN